MLRFKVIRLRKERLVHVEGPVVLPVLVPLVLSIVDLVVRRRSRKVQLPTSVNVPSYLISVRVFTSFGAIRIMSPASEARSMVRSEDGPRCQGPYRIVDVVLRVVSID